MGVGLPSFGPEDYTAGSAQDQQRWKGVGTGLQCLQRVLTGKVAMRCYAVGMHSALLRSRRQHSLIASLPADEQHAVSRLYSGSGVDAKSSVKRIAVQVRRCVS